MSEQFKPNAVATLGREETLRKVPVEVLSPSFYDCVDEEGRYWHVHRDQLQFMEQQNEPREKYSA